MDEQELAKLLERYRQDNCTAAERQLVESLHLRTYATVPVSEDKAAKHRIWYQLRKGLPIDNAKTRRIRWLVAAASVLVIASIVWLLRLGGNSMPIREVADISAGGNKAVLKMAGGQIVNLDSTQYGVVMLSDRLLYTDSTPVESIHDDQVISGNVYNEIITPRGGTYQVVLVDGTRVWLNADSKLMFPQQFAKSTREVTLIGEAYFDVAKSENHPFIVRTAGQEIAVLGTSFNVSAYKGELSERTTLVEGEIQVATPQRTHQLSPGEQALITPNEIKVGKVDTAPFVAWKSGLIAFNEETLAQIMSNISRWYDVDVHFEGVDQQLRFGGTVSRYANVSEVLRRLELTGQVHFKISERRIVVTP